MIVKIFDELNNDSMIVRNKVFVEEQGFVDEFDDIDKIAIHIIFYDEQPFATCRIFKNENNDYVIGRFAVLKEYRGRGIGTFMLKRAEEYIKSFGGVNVKIHAQTRAKLFYEKAGYYAVGVEDYDENVPHVWLKKELL